MIVPPMHKISKTIELHILMKASVPPREDMAHIAREIWIMEMKRIVYLNGFDGESRKKGMRNQFVWAKFVMMIRMTF